MSVDYVIFIAYICDIEFKRSGFAYVIDYYMKRSKYLYLTKNVLAFRNLIRRKQNEYIIFFIALMCMFCVCVFVCVCVCVCE